jgi:acyl-[acyl-carrier-protein]-phospholipid O-acyltransferase/long-chain-fatty-acid--[acyl-carrier-protein] ligase
LDEPEANKKTIDPQGWLVTGDLGRLDEDGFLFLSGRLARFSKIGGEMVPHERIEELIAEVLDSNDDVPQCAIVGVEDENKGEKLILLTTQALNPVSLRKALLQKGVSNLWIPKEIIDIEEVPRLASGKLDIRKLKEIAQQTLE